MFQPRKENIYNYLVLFLSSAFIIYFYGSVLIAPNQFLFSQYGDGFSQYFNFTSYAKHSQSYFEHTIPNYPYSEHIVYFDGQPFFGAILKFLLIFFPFLGDYSVGIINSIALFCIWWTPFLLYGILFRLKVRPLLAAWGAMGITFLEPQVFRMLGHFSLSYCAAIPLTLYLMLRIYERKNVIRWTILLLFSSFVWLFTHPYLGLACCLLACSTFFFYWICNIKTIATKVNFYLVTIISGVLPVVLFQIIMKLTDGHTSKPVDVYGIFDYNGEPDDVFLPNHDPLKSIIEAAFSVEIHQRWEGWAYVGLTTVLTLLIAFFIFTIRKIRKKNSPISVPYLPIVGITFWASVPILFLSWAFPFKQFPELLEHVKIIKQFRSLGRFAWVFYYVSTLTSIYLIHRAILVLEQQNRKILAGLLLFIGPFFYMIEGYPAHLEVAETIQRCPNYFIESHRPEILKKGFSKINPDDYQAILPLPYFYLGSGNYLRPILGGSAHIAMLTSAHTGIPIAAAAISRGDVWESRNLVQLISPPYYEKKIKADFPSKKPFLITRSNYFEKLSAYEQMIFDRAQLIAINEQGYAFYKLDFDALFLNECNQILDKFSRERSTLHQKNNWFVKDSSTYVYYESFEDQPTKHSFSGHGAFSRDKYGNGRIQTIPLAPSNATATQTYHVSAWVFNGEIDAMNYLLIMGFGVAHNGSSKQLGLARVDKAEVINGDWSLVEFSFTVPPNTFKELYIDHYSRVASKKRFYLDDLLIYTGDEPVYKITKEEKGQVNALIYNGHSIIRTQYR